MNRVIPLILAVALFMESMDSTVISTSLPAIAADMGTSPIALKLALAAYFVSLAIFIPISSWIADQFGAKRIFRVALGVFALGSIACALSGSLLEFVLARFAQGIGGAMMTPLARLILVRTTPKQQLVGAMALLTTPSVVGPIIGPPVGGFITTYFSWHWIFLINVPIGAAGIWLTGMFLPEMERLPGKKIDIRGFFLAAFAAAGVVFGLSVISLPAIPPVIGAAAIAIGVGAGYLYVRHAAGWPNPVLDLGLLASPIFRASIVGGGFFRVASGGTPFLLPLMFQLGFGMTPFQSGLITFIAAVGALSVKFIAPGLLRGGGFRAVLMGAGAGGALMCAAMAFFTPQTPWWLIMSLLFASGFFRSLFFTSSNALSFVDIDVKDASQASAIMGVNQQIAMAIGISLAGGVLDVMSRARGAMDHVAFMTAFLAVAFVMGLSVIFFARLPADAGNSVTGYKGKGAPRDEAAPKP